MSYLLFMDESGHDHKSMPYEVRGGIAMSVDALWPFVSAMRQLELSAFGAILHDYGKELKGHKLLDKDRFKWAAQGSWMPDEERRKACLAFLNRGLKREPPRRHEFTAYGQACLTMVRGMFRLLDQHGAVVLASAIPRDTIKPKNFAFEDYLRKDHEFLFERYFGLLDGCDQSGLIVLDETEKTEDRRFMQRLSNYFSKTRTGMYRASRIVPVPLFVASDMSYPVQAADCVIYCINGGFRVQGMDAPVRQEVADESADWLRSLQERVILTKSGTEFMEYTIKYVPDPYASRRK